MVHLIKIWLKWFFMALTAGSLTMTGILLWLAEPAHQEVSPELDHKAMTQIDKPLLVERKGDRLLWRMQAESANQNPDGNLELDAPELDLFSGDGVEVPVRSRKAFVDTTKREIRFRGDVVVIYDRWELRGQVLIYDINRDLIHMPAQFQLNGPGITVKGKNMTIDRNRQHVLVEERVWVRDDSAGHWPIKR